MQIFIYPKISLVIKNLFVLILLDSITKAITAISVNMTFNISKINDIPDLCNRVNWVWSHMATLFIS